MPNACPTTNSLSAEPYLHKKSYTPFALKPGLDEKLYERALVIELTKQGLRCDEQREFIVHYDGQHIGSLIPDLIVEDMVIVDPKVVTGFNENHLAQMLG